MSDAQDDPLTGPGALEFARRTLDAQPFRRLVGARITRFGAGRATLEVDVREELHRQNGYVHGGVLAYAADNAITFAAGSTLGAAVLTGSVSVQYLRPGLGRTLRAEAHVVHAGRTGAGKPRRGELRRWAAG